jgi:hypothetical protein
MRENLFHGKRKDNGKWVEGYYVPVGEYYYILTGKLGLVSYLVSYLGVDYYHNNLTNYCPNCGAKMEKRGIK